MVKNSILNKKMFNIIHLDEIIKIDFIVKKDSEFRKTEFRRRKKVKIGDLEIFIASIKDLILSKLILAKASHSEVQFRDIGNLLKEKVDLKYLKKWVSTLQLKTLFDEIPGEHNGK